MKRVWHGLGGTAALGILLTACSPNTEVASPTPQPSTAPTRSEGSTADMYRDGNYTARGVYGGLPSHQDVTLTVSDDTVVDVSITTPAEDETSLGYQQRFAQALPGAIVGRKVDEIAIDRLAGSSGCSEGFMNALRQIQEQASTAS